MPKHALLFVHGMGGADPTDDYERLWSGIASAWSIAHRREREEFDDAFVKVEISWGHVTATAKSALHRLAFATDFVDLQPSMLLQPIDSLRTFMTKFLGDVVAYVAEEDNQIRREFFADLEVGLRGAEGYSIVAHSLGSAIAHDFVFDLMVRGRLFDPLEQPTAGEIARLQSTFHALFTMGSPVGLFMLRKSAAFSTPEPFSELRSPLLPGQRWLNFWDPQDIIAYPVTQLFGGAPSIEDVQVDTGDLVLDSHVRYWRNEDVAFSIASALQDVA